MGKGQYNTVGYANTVVLFWSPPKKFRSILMLKANKMQLNLLSFIGSQNKKCYVFL